MSVVLCLRCGDRWVLQGSELILRFRKPRTAFGLSTTLHREPGWYDGTEKLRYLNAFYVSTKQF